MAHIHRSITVLYCFLLWFLKVSDHFLSIYIFREIENKIFSDVLPTFVMKEDGYRNPDYSYYYESEFHLNDDLDIRNNNPKDETDLTICFWLYPTYLSVTDLTIYIMDVVTEQLGFNGKISIYSE